MASESVPEAVTLNAVAYWTIRNAKCNKNILIDVQSVEWYVYVHYREILHTYRTERFVYFYLATEDPVLEAMLMMKNISPKLRFARVR